MRRRLFGRQGQGIFASDPRVDGREPNRTSDGPDVGLERGGGRGEEDVFLLFPFLSFLCEKFSGVLVAPVQQPQRSQRTGMFLRVGTVVSYLWIQDGP